MENMKFIGMAVFLITAVACGQKQKHNEPAEFPDNWKKYENKDYRIHYPDTFDLNTSGFMGFDFILFSKATSLDDKFIENIGLMKQNLKHSGISMNQFVELSETQISEMITDVDIIESKRVKKGNLEYHKLIYTSRQGKSDLKTMQYYFLENEIAYVLNFTSEEDQFDNYINDSIEIMDSFVVK